MNHNLAKNNVPAVVVSVVNVLVVVVTGTAAWPS